MEYYSKFNPNLSATVLHEEVMEDGCVPALLHGAKDEEGNPYPSPTYSIIKLDEWSKYKTSTLAGSDHRYVIFDDEFNVIGWETDEDVAIERLRVNAFAYVPVNVLKHAVVLRGAIKSNETE